MRVRKKYFHLIVFPSTMNLRSSLAQCNLTMSEHDRLRSSALGNKFLDQLFRVTSSAGNIRRPNIHIFNIKY